jgi:hypothetical protein
MNIIVGRRHGLTDIASWKMKRSKGRRYWTAWYLEILGRGYTAHAIYTS